VNPEQVDTDELMINEMVARKLLCGNEKGRVYSQTSACM